MALVDRYLHSVKKYLPRAQRTDILAELADTLETQVAEESARLGRALTDDEVAAILTRYGEPAAVAARFGARQYLIGPAAFRSYVFSVKLALAVLLPFVLLSIGFAIANDADRSLASRLIGPMLRWAAIALANVALVTAIFAFTERRARPESDEPWDPRDLPGLPSAPAPIRRADAIGSIVWLMILLLWWQGINAALWRWFGWEPSPFGAAPIWDRVTPLVLLFVGAGIAREVVALARPGWVRQYVVSGVLLDVLGLTCVATLLGAREWITVIDPQATRTLFVDGLNRGVSMLLMALLILFAVSAVMSVRRLVLTTRAATA